MKTITYLEKKCDIPEFFKHHMPGFFSILNI